MQINSECINKVKDQQSNIEQIFDDIDFVINMNVEIMRKVRDGTIAKLRSQLNHIKDDINKQYAIVISPWSKKFHENIEEMKCTLEKLSDNVNNNEITKIVAPDKVS